MSTYAAALSGSPSLAPPPPYQGDLIASLVEAVARVEDASGAKLDDEMRSGPALVRKEDARNYFRLTEVPPTDAAVECCTADCDNPARLLLDSRDSEVLPYCPKCAHVEFAMWMVGV